MKTNTKKQFIGRLSLVSLLALSASGCWLGKSSDKVILEGKRIEILNTGDVLTKNTTLSQTNKKKFTIKLGKPTKNLEWESQGGPLSNKISPIKANGQIQLLWHTNFGEESPHGFSTLAQPIIANGVIYTIDTYSHINAYDMENGDVKWSYSPESKFDATEIGGRIAYGKGKIIFTTGLAKLVCLDAKTGKVLWSQDQSTVSRSGPVIHKNVVISVDLNNTTTAYDVNSGDLLWMHTGIPQTTNMFGHATPAISEDIVYVPHTSGEIYALKVQTGHILWSNQLSSTHQTSTLGRLNTILSHPVVDEDFVYISSPHSSFMAIEKRTGIVAWTLDVKGLQTPWVGDNVVFAMNNQNILHVIDKNNGILISTQKLDNRAKSRKTSGKWGQPLVVNSKIYLSNSQGYAYMIPPEATDKAERVNYEHDLSVSPIFVDGYMILLSSKGQIFVYKT